MGANCADLFGASAATYLLAAEDINGGDFPSGGGSSLQPEQHRGRGGIVDALGRETPPRQEAYVAVSPLEEGLE